MFEQDFEDMLLRYQENINDKKKFTGLVKDMFPDQARTINLILMAYDIGIAQDIARTNQISNAFAYRYVKQLVDDYGMNRRHADWVVSLWCVCYGKDILHKSCAIALQKPDDKKPAIQAENTGGSGKTYADLFTYRKSIYGKGLSVTGFTGNSTQVIIVQNRYGGKAVTEIADEAFTHRGVEEAIVTEGIRVIGKRAFAKNEKLHQVVLPDSIREIDDGAFYGCEGLKILLLPMFVETIGAQAFAGTGLKAIAFPQYLYGIGEEAFKDCRSLDHIDIPMTLLSIAKGLFEGCNALKKVVLHEGLERIEERAFFGCGSLDFITIPDSVHEIGPHAFDGTDKRFIIQCSFGSYAESYARDHRIKYQLT